MDDCYRVVHMRRWGKKGIMGQGLLNPVSLILLIALIVVFGVGKYGAATGLLGIAATQQGFVDIGRFQDETVEFTLGGKCNDVSGNPQFGGVSREGGSAPALFCDTDWYTVVKPARRSIAGFVDLGVLQNEVLSGENQGILNNRGPMDGVFGSTGGAI